MPSRPTPETYLAQLDELPPHIVTSLATIDRRAMTHAQIAERLGWSVKKVSKFANLRTWRGISIEDIDAYRAACGVSRAYERRARFYVRRTMSQAINSWNHLRKVPRKPKWFKEIESKINS